MSSVCTCCKKLINFQFVGSSYTTPYVHPGSVSSECCQLSRIGLKRMRIDVNNIYAAVPADRITCRFRDTTTFG